MASLNDLVPSGVVTGDDLLTLLEHARANSYALPAVNCTRYVLVSTAKTMEPGFLQLCTAKEVVLPFGECLLETSFDYIWISRASIETCVRW